MEKTPPPQRIESERITLSQHAPEVAEQFFTCIESDRARLREFLPWVDHIRTLEDEREYVRMTLEQWRAFELFDYGIYRKSDSLFLGCCGVHSLSWQNRRCELGYWIHRQFEGQGYVSEAVRAIENAFFGLGFNRIEIHCSSQNARSARVPIAARYQLEGTLRQACRENGQYSDTSIFAKLASDASGEARTLSKS